MPPSLHSLWAFCNLSISALIIARSPGESMAQECTLPHTQVKCSVRCFPDRQRGHRLLGFIYAASLTEHLLGVPQARSS